MIIFVKQHLSFFLRTCAPESGEKHKATSSALLLKHTLLPTMMVSGRVGCSVDYMGCPMDCIGCSWCVVHQNYQGCLYQFAAVQ